MKDNIVLDKSFEFGIRVVNLHKQMNNNQLKIKRLKLIINKGLP